MVWRVVGDEGFWSGNVVEDGSELSPIIQSIPLYFLPPMKRDVTIALKLIAYVRNADSFASQSNTDLSHDSAPICQRSSGDQSLPG